MKYIFKSCFRVTSPRKGNWNKRLWLTVPEIRSYWQFSFPSRRTEKFFPKTDLSLQFTKHFKITVNNPRPMDTRLFGVNHGEYFASLPWHRTRVGGDLLRQFIFSTVALWLGPFIPTGYRCNVTNRSINQ